MCTQIDLNCIEANLWSESLPILPVLNLCRFSTHAHSQIPSFFGLCVRCTYPYLSAWILLSDKFDCGVFIWFFISLHCRIVDTNWLKTSKIGCGTCASILCQSNKSTRNFGPFNSVKSECLPDRRSSWLHFKEEYSIIFYLNRIQSDDFIFLLTQVIGYGNVAITFALQPVMKWACDRLTGFWRVAVCDAFLFFSFIGTVNVWRGVWELLDIHFMPGKQHAMIKSS